jgi:hypothetical protein
MASGVHVLAQDQHARNRFAVALLLATVGAQQAWPQTTDPESIAGVAKRGADVMPFDLQATLHIFTEASDGGVQRVVARRRGDATQA